MKIHIPAFIPMARCNEHLAHGPIDVDLGPDVVPVVRCGECKHWQRNFGVVDSPNGHCFYLDFEMNGHDFCSYGERKDGAE